MAVANDVSKRIRQHCPSPCGDKQSVHFPQAGGSAVRMRHRPAHSFVSRRQAPPPGGHEKTNHLAGISGNVADCPMTARIGDSDGARSAI